MNTIENILGDPNNFSFSVNVEGNGNYKTLIINSLFDEEQILRVNFQDKHILFDNLKIEFADQTEFFTKFFDLCFGRHGEFFPCTSKNGGLLDVKFIQYLNSRDKENYGEVPQLFDGLKKECSKMEGFSEDTDSFAVIGEKELYFEMEKKFRKTVIYMYIRSGDKRTMIEITRHNVDVFNKNYLLYLVKKNAKPDNFLKNGF